LTLTAGGFAFLWGLPSATPGSELCEIDGASGTWQFSADQGVGGPGVQGEGATYSCFGLRICCVPIAP
jgi:hypothetical protein